MKRPTSLIFVIVLMLAITATHTIDRRPLPATHHVLLIGASIGQAWKLPQWGERVSARDFSVESVAAWQFDKSEALDEALIRPRRKFHATRTYLKSIFRPPPRPADIVIIKECSSYFPGDLDGYLAKVRRWIGQIRARGIVPMVATVVPITRERSARDRGKQESLRAFNRRLRSLAAEEQFALLDLETALSDGSESGYLRNQYTSGDGSHLNAAAYAVLDPFLLAALRSTRQTAERSPLRHP